MTKTILLSLVVAVSLFAVPLIPTRGSNAFAAPKACVPGEGKTTVLYVNGVNNPNAAENVRSIKFLQQALRDANGPNVPTPTVYGFWNPGHLYADGALGNILGVAADAVRVTTQQRWLDIGTSFVTAVTGVGAPELASAMVAYRESLVQEQTAIVGALVIKIKQHVGNGEKVVLVPHSAGNIVVDQAIAILQKDAEFDMSAVGVVNVASPDLAEAGNGAAGTSALHLTSNFDPVIKPVPGRVSADFVPAYFEPNSIGHNFIDVYLNGTIKDKSGTSLRDQLLSDINSVIDSIQSCGLQLAISPPSATMESGKQQQFSVVATNPGRDQNSRRPRIKWTALDTFIAIVSSTTVGPAATAIVLGTSEVAVTGTLTATDEVTKNYLNAVLTVIPSSVCKVPPFTGASSPQGTVAKMSVTIGPCRILMYGAPATKEFPAFNGRATTAPSHGVITFAGNSVSYMPSANYHGPDSFAYAFSAVNGSGTQLLLQVKVEVTVN